MPRHTAPATRGSGGRCARRRRRRRSSSSALTASPSPTRRTDVAVTTWPPAASVISASLVTIALPPSVRMPVDRQLRRQLVAGDDRARVAEALLGVQHARQLDAGVGLGEQLLQRELLRRPSRRSAARRRRRSRAPAPRPGRSAAGRRRRRRGRTRAPSRGRRGRGPSAGIPGRRARGSLAPCHPTERARAAPAALAPATADRAQRHLHRDDDEERGEQHVADERVDDASRARRRAPWSCRPRRRRAPRRRGRRCARRTLPIVPETAVGIIMSSDVPLAIESLVPNSSMSAGTTMMPPPTPMQPGE